MTVKIKKLLILFFICPAIYLAAQNTATQEIKDLSPLLKANRWSLEKAFVKASDTTVEIGGQTVPALKLWYFINHRQPDGTSRAGWPYANNRSIPAELRDWNRYDSVEMKLRGTITRIDEENLPIIVAFVPEKGNRTETSTTIYGVGLLKLSRGKWVDLSIPIAKMNELAKTDVPVKIKEIKIFLDGSQYKHADELEVEIAKFQLVRELVSRVKTLKLLAPAIYADAPILPVELLSVGNEKELGAGLPVEIRDSSNNKAWAVKLPLTQGTMRYDLDIASAKLRPGKYKLVFSPESDLIRQEASFTVVTSPWQ